MTVLKKDWCEMMFFTINEDMIKEYILGKLPEEQARVVEQQLAKDSALKAQYDELKQKEDLLRYYDSMQLKEDRISVLKKRFDASRQNPVWGRGQVWKLHDFGWFLILAVNEQYQCRGIIMNHSTHFSGSRDVLFHADTIASRQLCAFTDHICTVTPDNLTRYGSELNDQTVSIISAAVSGSTPKLPEGFSFGEEIHDEEAEAWHEYISDVCTRLTNEALEAYENASDISRDILRLTQPRPKSAASVKSLKPPADIRKKKSYDVSESNAFLAEDDMKMYSLPPMRSQKLAAASEFSLDPEKTLLYKGEEVKVEVALERFIAGITLITTLAGGEKQIDRLTLNFQGVSFFEETNISLVRKIARLTILHPETLARFAILPVELVIQTEKKTYTIKLEVRKGKQ